MARSPNGTAWRIGGAEKGRQIVVRNFVDPILRLSNADLPPLQGGAFYESAPGVKTPG